MNRALLRARVRGWREFLSVCRQGACAVGGA